jgi:site-specific DNA recombinase
MPSVAMARRGGLAPLTDEMDAYLYTRVSSDEQGAEGLSLPNQEHRGLEYIAQKRWRHCGTFTDVLTGKRDDRVGYQAVLREIRGAVLSGRRPLIVVNMLDRLGRRIAERIRAWDEFKALGVPLHVVDKGGEVDELTYNVLAAVAQEESRLTSQRVKQVRERARQLGWHESGRAPWGYRWRPATDDERRSGAPKSVLELHPDEAPYVVDAWSMLARGTSLKELARWAATLPSVARSGRNLNFGVLRTTFRAPVYVGRNGNGDDVDSVLERPLGRWPQLITDEVWLQVRASVDKGKRKLPSQASGKYLLTGFLRCDRCGSRMAGNTMTTKHTKSGIFRAYVCTGWATGARREGTCRSRSVSADTLDYLVMRHVTEMLAIATQPQVIDAARAAWAEEEQRYLADPSAKQIADLDRDIAKARGRIHRNHTLFVDGDITKQAYLEAQDEYQGDIEAAETERAGLTGRVARAALPPFYVVLENVKGWYRGIQASLTVDPDAVRGALAEVLEKVTPVPQKKFGKYEIDPVWTTTGRMLLDTVVRFGASANLVHVERFGTSNLSTCETRSTPGAAA